MTDLIFEISFLYLDAIFATISLIACILFFLRSKHSIRWLFLFFAPFFLVVSGGFWLRALQIIELGEVADFLRPTFAIIFLVPALFFFALKDWLK